MYDYTIIGGGIVGLSSAWQLQQLEPNAKILVLEKETVLASHQTGRNSGVIHAGVYYAPKSLKAQFCTSGAKATFEFCQQHGIKTEQCGKLIVACDRDQLHALADIETRSRANGIVSERLTQAQLVKREPLVKGLGALYVPSTGIVDYTAITEKLAQLFIQAGGEIRKSATVIDLVESSDSIQIKLNGSDLTSKFLIVCAGLQADQICAMIGIECDFKIVPFRGEYYRLSESCNINLKHLIYPVPDPRLPFLGVHLTKMIDGSITVGPNAVPAFKREGYSKIEVNFGEMWQLLKYQGYRRLIGKYWRFGLGELFNSLFKRAYLKRIQRYCPSVQLDHLELHRPGVRAQAVNAAGELIDDFHFLSSARSLHVCNAPSPAATSALPIGAYVVKKARAQAAQLDLRQ
ncbi:L-2-hydroxyglutarate oxidase [Alginatibacterium sediminis]|uniref:L-2-hydroxyglutarate oxidase n=1 Tax=Alginatibacterium sediminis TaxID=2164068 RepID=A0A420E983_9ALTE|nr:L-2-hydroxyglutarate oxidase [Alginatibacterium sediminis]